MARYLARVGELSLLETLRSAREPSWPGVRGVVKFYFPGGKAAGA